MDPAKLKPIKSPATSVAKGGAKISMPAKSFDATLASRAAKPTKANAKVDAKSTILAAIENAGQADQEAAAQAEGQHQLGLSLSRQLLSNPKAGSIDRDQAYNPEDDDE